MPIGPGLNTEEKAELTRAIDYYLDNHRATNEPMRFFLVGLKAQLEHNNI